MKEENGCEMDEYEGDYFNIESSAATAELEESLRSEAIGTTLYDKKWVLRTVMSLAEREAGEGNSEDGAVADDLVSLVEMTVESDVCVFLTESGCFDVILGCLSRGRSERITEHCLNILCNVASRTEGGKEALPAVVTVLFNSADACVLKSAFKFLKYVCEHDCDEFVEKALTTCFLDDSFAGRVSLLLASSSNQDLLDSASRFLMSLFHASMEKAEDELLDSAYASPDFMSACTEAMAEAGGSSAISQRLLEVVGLMCNRDNVAGCSRALCDVVAAQMGAAEMSGETLSLSGKVLLNCWTSTQHQESYEALSSMLCDLEESLAVEEGDTVLRAAKENITNCLQQYRVWHN